jgi:hypothetical protein
VSIDSLSPRSLGSHRKEILDHPPKSAGLPVVPIEALIYMKLTARRRKDQLDIVELIKAGADVDKIRRYLSQHASDLLPLFEQLAGEEA